MANSSFWGGVREVLHLLKEHSEKYQRQKQATTNVERWSGWVALVGGVIFIAGAVMSQVGDFKIPAVYWTCVALIVLGFIPLAVGTAVNLIESVRTTRSPVVEHIVRVDEALERERELLAALQSFDTEILEFARARLQLESTKVASRLGVIGGGDGLRTSLVGVAVLGAALISQYEPVPSWTMKSLTFWGIVLLLGMSIGGLFVRYGVSQADYYSEIIGLALQRKAHSARKRREPFLRRAKRKMRTLLPES